MNNEMKVSMGKSKMHPDANQERYRGGGGGVQKSEWGVRWVCEDCRFKGKIPTEIDWKEIKQEKQQP